MSVTFLISSSSEAGAMIFLVSLVFLGQGSEMDIIKFCNLSESMSCDEKSHSQGNVTSTNKITLDSYCVDLYLFDIRDPKNLRNKKKDNCSSVTSTRFRKGHARVTWPWHTRSRLIVTVWIYIYLTSATIKTCETKKDNCSCVTSTWVRKGHA